MTSERVLAWGCVACVIPLALGCARNPSAGVTSGDEPDTPADDAASRAGDAALASDAGNGKATGVAEGTLTEEEWFERRSLQYVEHSIREGGHCAEAPLLDPAAPVQPSTVCAWFSFPDERHCDVAPYCLSDADCDDRPHGTCRGIPSPARCDYGIDTWSRCDVDVDCDRLPSGRCSPWPITERRCFPTGECWDAGTTTCDYPSEECDSDADCRAAPQGRCVAPIGAVQCEYYECVEDGHCPGGQRCACTRCVPAECFSDVDCGQGRCQLSIDCGFAGYFCTTPNDACADADDCDGRECRYAGDRWSCRTDNCPTVP